MNKLRIILITLSLLTAMVLVFMPRHEAPEPPVMELSDYICPSCNHQMAEGTVSHIPYYHCHGCGSDYIIQWETAETIYWIEIRIDAVMPARPVQINPPASIQHPFAGVAGEIV